MGVPRGLVGPHTAFTLLPYPLTGSLFLARFLCLPLSLAFISISFAPWGQKHKVQSGASAAGLLLLPLQALLPYSLLSLLLRPDQGVEGDRSGCARDHALQLDAPWAEAPASTAASHGAATSSLEMLVPRCGLMQPASWHAGTIVSVFAMADATACWNRERGILLEPCLNFAGSRQFFDAYESLHHCFFAGTTS